MKGGSSYRESHRGRDAALESPPHNTSYNDLYEWIGKVSARRRRAEKKNSAPQAREKKINITFI